MTMWWKKAECPVRSEEQVWIDENLDGLVAEFGADLLQRPVAIPQASWFPAGYTGSEDDVRAVYRALCTELDVPPDRVRLDLVRDDAEDLHNLPGVEYESSGAVAHWQRRDGVTVVTVDLQQARQPVALVATIVHELGHERLLGEDRIERGRRDGEPLTDLFAVAFGFGIFSANAAFDFHRTDTHWGTSRLGYLTEPMYGYALARYAWLRGEADPEWAKHLDTNPRVWMKQGLRFLQATAGRS
jgi:hypothetical protein